MPGIALTQSYPNRIIYQPLAGRVFIGSLLERGRPCPQYLSFSGYGNLLTVPRPHGSFGRLYRLG